MDDYACIDLVWQDHEIAVRYQSNWLNTQQWHIELRCTQRLPVTDTGYRSIFVSCAEPADAQGVRDLVVGILDDAAESVRWKRHVEDSRQLDLF